MARPRPRADSGRPPAQSHNPRTKWPTASEKIFCDYIRDAAVSGTARKNGGKQWRDDFWQDVAKLFPDDETKTVTVCQNKYQYMKNHFNCIRKILQYDGFSWDDRTGKLAADKEKWVELGKTDRDLVSYKNRQFVCFRQWEEIVEAIEDNFTMAATLGEIEANADAKDFKDDRIKLEDDEEPNLFVSDDDKAPVPSPKRQSPAVKSYIKPRSSIFKRSGTMDESKDSDQPPAKKPKISENSSPLLSSTPAMPPANPPQARRSLPPSQTPSSTGAGATAGLNSTSTPVPQPPKEELAIAEFLRTVDNYDLTDEGIAQMLLILENALPASTFLQLPAGVKKHWIRGQLKKTVGEEGLTSCYV